MQEKMLYQRGPDSLPRASYTRTGLGQFKQVRGNPISWGIDCFGNCWPFLSLRGGQDKTTQEVRGAIAEGLQPRQTVLRSRGVIGIVERADGGGNLQQPYTVGPVRGGVILPQPDPGNSGLTKGSSSDCGGGKIRVSLGGGRFRCAVPWGRR